MKTLLSVFAAASMTAAVAAWTAPPPAYDHVVRILDMNYSPDNLEIAIGDKVIWKNFDTKDHTATAQFWPTVPQEQPYFDSGPIGSGGTFEFIFVKEGTYRYVCSFTPGLRGTIVVRR